MNGDDALLFHVCHSAVSSKDHLSLRSVLHWLDPCAVAVDVVEDHLVVVVLAGLLGIATCPVGE